MRKKFLIFLVLICFFMFCSCGQKESYYEDEVLQVVDIETNQSSAGNYISLIKVSIKNNSDSSLLLLCPIFNCYDENGKKVFTTTKDDVVGETSISENKKETYKIPLKQKNIQKVELKEIIYTIYDSKSDKDITKKIDVIGNLKEQKEKAEQKEKDKQEQEKDQKQKEDKSQKEKSKKDSNSLNEEQLYSYKDYAQQCVNSVLKSPSTAEYPGSFLNPFEGWNIIKKDKVVTIESYVDSQNSFGAIVRSYFVIKIKYANHAKPFYMKVDDTVYIDN